MEAPGGITKSVLESLRALPLEASTHDLAAVTSSAPSGGLASPTAALRSAVLRSTTLALAGRETSRPPMLKRQARPRALDLRGIIASPERTHLAARRAAKTASNTSARAAHVMGRACSGTRIPLPTPASRHHTTTAVKRKARPGPTAARRKVAREASTKGGATSGSPRETPEPSAGGGRRATKLSMPLPVYMAAAAAAAGRARHTTRHKAHLAAPVDGGASSTCSRHQRRP